MLEYLILDMGNVLLDFDPGYALAHFCPDEESREIIRKALFEGPWWIAGDRGDITNEERYARVLPEVPEKYREALALCVDRWDECMVPLSGTREFLAWARKKGLGLYVLSNACSRFYSYFPKQLPLSLFDGVVVSSPTRGYIRSSCRAFRLRRKNACLSTIRRKMSPRRRRSASAGMCLTVIIPHLCRE